MSEVEQLEQRIASLAPQEFVKLRDWFGEFEARVWDE